jgi:hypothetical protein
MTRWSAFPQSEFQSPMTSIAVVVEAIAPYQIGLIKFQGRWHAANCNLSMTLLPDSLVQVVGDVGGCLAVIPVTDPA